ncbi:MAG: hypothetical protein U0359_18310 [Byssovorax sp.]
MKRTFGTILAALTLAACQTSPSPSADRPAQPGPGPGPAPAHASAWTLLGDAPSPRRDHAAILDAARDRMLVFGGDANDLWAEDLSGPTAGRFTRLDRGGALPPPEPAVLAIDEATQRLLVFPQRSLDRAYALPLDSDGDWTEVSFSAAPEIALGFSLAVDPIGRRIFAYTSAQPEVFVASLDGASGWTQIAGAPHPGGFSCRDTLVYDGDHGQLLVLSGGWPRGDVFALSLGDTPAWTQLNKNQAFFEYESTAVFDAKARRYLIAEPSTSDWLWSFSVDDAEATWTHLPILPSEARGQRLEMSAVFDPKQDRVLFFGGRDTTAASALRDDTWALSLDETAGTPRFDRVGSLDRTLPLAIGARLAEVPETGALFRLGGSDTGYGSTTTLRFDHATAAWTPLDDAAIAPAGWSGIAWDPMGQRFLSFGGYVTQQPAVLRAFDPSSDAWSMLPDPAGAPKARYWHSMVHDPAAQRMLIFGGQELSGAATVPFGDVWALSLADQSFTPVTPAGPAPAGRYAHAAAFDPEARRMLIHGGYNASALLTDGWMLELLPEPHWRPLSPKGDVPPGLSDHAAVYDPDAHRFLLVGNIPVVPGEMSERVGIWALSNDGEDRWQRICARGLMPRQMDGARWTERGLVVLSGGSTWIFDPSAAVRCE